MLRELQGGINADSIPKEDCKETDRMQVTMSQATEKKGHIKKTMKKVKQGITKGRLKSNTQKSPAGLSGS